MPYRTGLRRLLRIYRAMWGSNLSREMLFRANFWAKILENVIWLAYFILIVQVIYSRTDSVAGWGRGDAHVLMATCFLLQSIIYAFFAENLLEIPEKVRRGTLDYDLVKPADIQFLLSLRKFKIDEVGTLLVGSAWLIVGVKMSGAILTLFAVVGYVYLLLCAVILFYSLKLSLMLLSIWFIRVDNLWVLSESVVSVARYPLDIFRASLQRALTYIVPLAFLATVPSRALLGTLHPVFYLYALVWTLAFFIGSRLFLRYALRHYTGSSA